MHLITSVGEMQTIGTNLRQRGMVRLKLVPTMGALHKGHGSLIELAKTQTTPPCSGLNDQDSNFSDGDSSDCKASANIGDSLLLTNDDARDSNSIVIVTVVSIFVNPAQFNDPKDLAAYPSTLESDLKLCQGLGVDYVFKPDNTDIYPGGSSASTVCMIEPPQYLGSILEGRSRPGHFRGMLTVVNKLINIVQPHEIYFGEKDYQQLVLANRMIADLNLRVQVCPAITFRADDMLPMSSRNSRLDKLERKLAPIIYTLLSDAKLALESCPTELMTGELSINQIIAASVLATRISRLCPSEEAATKLTIDYIELKCANDLTDVKLIEGYKAFDCEFGCAMGNNNKASGDRTQNGIIRILKCRLLTSIIVGGTRLLDNIEVKFNRSHQGQTH